MREETIYPFSYKEVVEALIKKRGLHEGFWSLRVEFGIGAANVNKEVGSKELTPAAIVPLVSLGLQPGTEENSLTVDAATVNPGAARRRAGGKRATKTRVRTGQK